MNMDPKDRSHKSKSKTADLSVLEPMIVCGKDPTVATSRFRTHRSSKQPEGVKNKKTIIRWPIEAPQLFKGTMMVTMVLMTV